MRTPNIILLALPLILSIACDHSTLSEKSFQRLIDEFEIVEQYNGDHSTLYLIYEDHGFADRAYYLYKHDQSATYHKISEHSKYYPSQVWQGHIINTCRNTGRAIDSVRWVRITRYQTNDGQEGVSLNREPSIPEDFIPAEVSEKTLYKWENHSLVKQGTLNEFCSPAELQDGLYMLTPPGVFYTELYDLDEVDTDLF